MRKINDSNQCRGGLALDGGEQDDPDQWRIKTSRASLEASNTLKLPTLEQCGWVFSHVPVTLSYMIMWSSNTILHKHLTLKIYIFSVVFFDLGNIVTLSHKNGMVLDINTGSGGLIKLYSALSNALVVSLLYSSPTVALLHFPIIPFLGYYTLPVLQCPSYTFQYDRSGLLHSFNPTVVSLHFPIWPCYLTVFQSYCGLITFSNKTLWSCLHPRCCFLLPSKILMSVCHIFSHDLVHNNINLRTRFIVSCYLFLNQVTAIEYSH